ncbi:MAG: hypothetical protein COU90_04680 [Candidatus Ryanbacteria bacterium CG10_big_fil_rev_8_21_14_0_10_43_42]|uniref:Uncharacterized protein n=1 Tax=Candidatus Ryanbacteria bacterium CG10_big_fil_rev_8_21_14_0_10_43_42 TaxID=1974864 RepID=A0A2M8KW47_9BACT|nr:MAG: hypothetical protein COU90_04680 [Candidatus Ryanbacteria bacterium CG10_big_fil_rev_8_21_14_0_10_43_42]
MNKGFIQSIIIIILLLVIISLLGVSLTSVFNDKTLQENFKFVSNGINIFWNSYGKEYATTFWNLIKNTLGNLKEHSNQTATSTSSDG